MKTNLKNYVSTAQQFFTASMPTTLMACSLFAQTAH